MQPLQKKIHTYGAKPSRNLFAVVAVSIFAAVTQRQVEAKAKPGRFVVDAKAETVLDTATKRTWQRAVPVGSYAWQDAKIFCKNLQLAGGGWRLPTLRELESIIDFGEKNPAVDKTAFPNAPTDNFWSATLSAKSASEAWYVVLDANNNGTDSYGDIGQQFRARCIR